MLKRAFKDTLPVLAGYLVLGIGFGIIMSTSGYSPVWSLVMSLFIYAGSMQYAGIGLLTGGASLISVALTTLMVNARHLFYGISMVDKYKKAGKIKPYLIFGLTDETYALVVKEDASGENRYFFLITVLDHFYWVAGSMIGALVGTVITFDTTGIDFALTALFITIFTDQWLKTKKHLPAIIGVAASVLSLIVFGRDSFLIPTMVIISVALLIMKRFAPGYGEDAGENINEEGDSL